MIQFLSLILALVSGCPFSQYEEGLLPSSKQTQTVKSNVTLKNNSESFSFGYWYFPVVQMGYQSLYYDDTIVTLFSLKKKTTTIIKHTQYYSNANMNFVITFTLTDVKAKTSSLVYKIPFYDYQDMWHFTLFTVTDQNTSFIIETAGQQMKKFANLTILQLNQEYNFIIGNDKVVDYYFLGRLSLPIIFQSYVYVTSPYSNFSEQCKIPAQVVGEQTVIALSGLVNFQNNDPFTITIFEQGRKYLLSGWVKHNIKEKISTLQQSQLRLSTNQQKTKPKSFGDFLFLLSFQLSYYYPKSSKMNISIDSYCFQNMTIHCREGYQDSILYLELMDVESTKYYDAFQQWSFFQYQYGISVKSSISLRFQMQFQDNTVYSQEISQIYKGTQTFSNFYLFIGESQLYNDPLNTSYYNVKFVHNYQDEKNLLYNQTIFPCHQNCKTCNGPLEDNCLSCGDFQSLIQKGVKKYCQCQIGFLQNQINNQIICTPILQEFPSIYFSQTDKQNYKLQCQLGYFKIPMESDEFLCIQCPESFLNEIFCADCLLNPNYWYQYPICSKDYKFSINGQYILSNRTVDDIDLYIIDEKYSLIQQNGYSSFCQLQQSLKKTNCHEVNKYHLLNKINIICKPNFYFKQGDCVLRDYICKSYDDDGNCSQCDNKMYLKEGRCLPCPQNCKSCYFNITQNNIICQSCIEAFGLINNQCSACGVYCSICVETYSDIKKVKYLKCLKCLDNSDYFISINGVNCLRNTIAGCKYAIQMSIKASQLSSDFLPDQAGGDIVTTCVQCKSQIYFELDTKHCVERSKYVEYDYAEACKFYVNSECIVSFYYADSYTYQMECRRYISNCALCQDPVDLYDLNLDQETCLICDDGYYADRLTGLCVFCPEIPNCLTCGQQQILTKDYWIVELRPYYRNFLENSNYHFRKNSQSQNRDDYELICLKCSDGFDLVNDKCIEECPKDCLQCELQDGKNICIKCLNNGGSGFLTIINNQCVQCPQFCTICNIRTWDEIREINPQFNDLNYIQYSYQCLKSKENNLKYDTTLGQFIQCEQNGVCQKTITIQLNLICSQSDFINGLNNHQTSKEQKLYKQQNIYVKQLFSENSFIEFENDNFYLMSNLNQIQQIYIIVQSENEQVCELDNFSQINQQFSNHIFSLKYVELSLNFNKQVTFIQNGQTTFLNFHKISFNNINFRSSSNLDRKSIILASLYQQELVLDNIHFKQNQLISDIISIVVQNVTTLTLKDSTFENINSQTNTFFEIVEQTYQKTIILNSLVILDCNLSSSNFFSFNIGQQDQIKIENIKINGNFNNSNLLKISQTSQIYLQTQQFGDISIKNIEIFSNISSTKSFFSFEFFQNTSIEQIKIYNSKIRNSLIFSISSNNLKLTNIEQIQINNSLIRNSSIFSLSNNVKLSQISVDFCQLLDGSLIFYNSNTSENNISNITIQNLIFNQNTYDTLSQFVVLKLSTNQNSQVTISDLQLLNNFAVNQQFNGQNIVEGLILLSSKRIFVENFILMKGQGKLELSINEAENFTLQNSSISMGEKFKFYGLHSSLDCVLKSLQTASYNTAISISSTKYTNLKNITIQKIQTINSPIITYKSSDIKTQQQDEVISFESIILLGNFLLQSKSNSILSILQINSQQVVIVQFKLLQFVNNLLHSFEGNYLQSSSALINIDCPQCSIKIQQSKFFQNIVTNSSDSIIFINAKSLIIDESIFSENSIFNYQVLQPYLIWPFYQDKVYQEQIENIFQIKTLAGNGHFISENITILRTLVNQSKGQTGGAFLFEAQKNASIKLEGNQFSQIKTLFSNQFEQGGVLFIDGSNTESLDINIKNQQIENIFCKDQGGFIYLKTGNQNVKITINSINLKNIYSKQGSFINFQLLQYASYQQLINITNITFSNSISGFEEYLGNFKSFDQNDLEIIQKNRSVIYVDYGNKLQLKNIQLKNLYYESAMLINGVQQVSISSTEIYESKISNFLMKIQLIQYGNTNNSIALIDLKIHNISATTKNLQISCYEKPSDYPKIQQYCPKDKSISPNTISEQFSFDNFVQLQQDCLNGSLPNNQSLSPIGLIYISQITGSSSIQMSNTMIDSIDCNNCKNGLILFEYSKIQTTYNKNAIISNFKVLNTECGYQGCVNFEKDNLISQNRMLAQQGLDKLQFDVLIQKFTCYNNTGTVGTCLNMQNIKIQLSQSIMMQNVAKTKGGAIFVDDNSFIQMIDCQIKFNRAQIGGGLYFVQQQQINFQEQKNVILDNIADQESANFKAYPEKLNLYLQQDIPYLSKTIISNSTIKIDQIPTEEKNTIYVPSGQKINSYYIFNPQTGEYKKRTQIFRIRAVQHDNSWSKNLENSYCQIRSRKYNLTQKQEEQQFTNNFTNFNLVRFNSEFNEYQLDDLIIYFDPFSPNDVRLQLEFSCSSIEIPYVQQDNPTKVLNNQIKYYLRVNIRTFPCQYGEIINQTDGSCHLCDSSQGFFSLILNATQCLKKDDISTISVKSAKLQLKSGYWRPYFSSHLISQCDNVPQNCLGGWTYGDNSCQLGHLGALCEQCDLFNTRGDGSYQIRDKYECDSCNNLTKNYILIVFTVLWILAILYFASNGFYKHLQEYSKPQVGHYSKISKNLNLPQSGILIKILINYFQIVSAITTLQLNLNFGVERTINIIGNPLTTIANSQDCFLKEMMNLPIEYSKNIWLIILPFIFLIIFFIYHKLASILKIVTFNSSILSTSIIFSFIYFQPNIIGSFIQILTYREISGVKWIRANVADIFESDLNFYWRLFFVYPIIVILAAIIPFALFINLYYNKDFFGRKQFRQIHGYLYHEYKPQTYYWEIVKIVKKAVIIIFLSYYENFLLDKGILVLIVLLAYSQINSQIKPYAFRKLNNLDYDSAIVCILSFGLAIGISISHQNDLKELWIAFWIILIFFNLKFLLTLIFQLIKDGYRNYNTVYESCIITLTVKIPCIKKYKWANKTSQSQRTLELYQKLQSYLMSQARNSLQYKRQYCNSKCNSPLKDGLKIQGKLKLSTKEKYEMDNDEEKFVITPVKMLPLAQTEDFDGKDEV